METPETEVALGKVAREWVTLGKATRRAEADIVVSGRVVEEEE